MGSIEYISHEAAQLWIVSIGEVVISIPTVFSALFLYSISWIKAVILEYLRLGKTLD